MKRRSVSLVAVLVMALGVVASPVSAAPSHFPAQIDLPSGWRPEGITAGRGNTIFVGSLAGGGVWKGDVRTGQGAQFIPHWGGAAVGVEYDARADRLWVAGGPTGTVRVYDASSGDLLRQYTFAPAGFLNDLVVTRNAVYVTDSRNAWLDVIPLGPHGALSPETATTMLPLTGIPVETDRNNANGIVASGRWLIVVDSFTGGLFRVSPRTGVATPIDTGGASVANGDGLELRGRTLYVVRNQNNLVQMFHLDRRLTSARPGPVLTDPKLSIPSTAALQGRYLWAVNARFGVPTTEYYVTRLPAKR